MPKYIYDGTFEGLLTAIFEAFYNKEVPDRITPMQNSQQDLFLEELIIETDLVKAQRVYESIRTKISNDALHTAYYVFLSELEDSEMWIYHYLKLGWKLGAKVDMHLSDDRVLQAINTRRKVSFEVHRMVGLLRFRQLGPDTYYADYQPDHNITALLAPHFADRLADQNWMIHDVRREIAAIYDKKEWMVLNSRGYTCPISDEREADFQSMWKHYFKQISIDSRKNTRLQKQLMPARYWKFLVEKQ